MTTKRDYSQFFQPSALRIARQLKGLKKSDLAEQVERTAAAISQYESGANRPSSAIVARLAMALGVSTQFLSLDLSDRVNQTGNAFFRSLRATRQIDRDKAEAHVIAIDLLVRYLNKHVVFPDYDVPLWPITLDVSKEKIESAAEQLRELWELGNGPITSMTHLLESKGIIVNHVLNGRREIDAFTRRFSERPIITLATDKEDQARQRFDAAHELAHLVLHDETEAGNNLIEQQANVFAAAFLLPKDEMLRELPTRVDFRRLSMLKQRWGVSMQALLYRARELHIISHDAHRRAMMKVSSLGWRTKEPSPVQADENPTVLAKAVKILEENRRPLSMILEETALPESIVLTAVKSGPEQQKVAIVF